MKMEKQFKLVELFLKVDEDGNIENIISINKEMERDCKGYDERIVKAFEPAFELFEEIIKNSEE